MPSLAFQMFFSYGITEIILKQNKKCDAKLEFIYPCHMKCTTLTLAEVHCKSSLPLPQSLRKWRMWLLRVCTCALKSKCRTLHQQNYCRDLCNAICIGTV